MCFINVKNNKIFYPSFLTKLSPFSLSIIGFVIILAELWVGFILGWFTLFLSFLSKGVFYILLGLLVLGVAGVLGFITGLLFMILGVVLIFLGRNSFRYVTDR